MLLKSILILSLSIFVLGNSSCASRVIQRTDAFRCVLITVDDKGQERPLESWYWYCLNSRTKEEKSIWLKDSTKCLRDQSKPCKWIGTDALEYEKFIGEKPK